MLDASQTSGLNEGQEQAQKDVHQFLFSKDKEFSISGPAGVGKTHLMRHIIDHTLEEYKRTAVLLGVKPIDYEIVLCATTNKAAEVLAKATGYPASTIHSHLSLKVKDDYSTGKSKITKTANWKVHTKQIIFIDEASMIDTPLFQLILAGTDNTCKIIYLGDHCQLAPVFEDISPVYKNPKHTALLDQPMRNAGQPALVELCEALRDTVETGNFFQIPDWPGVIDHVDDQQAEDFIVDAFSHENQEARILAYSNARVSEYLGFTRALKGYPDHLTLGENVINNSGIVLGKDTIPVEAEFTIKSVDLTPHELVLDAEDPNAVVTYYLAEIQSGVRVYEAKIPFDQAHTKALMRHYGNKKDFFSYYKIKNTFPDLRGRDASTVYKSQGSTYDTVFVDLKNIGTCTDRDQLARMVYVACSRARNRLVIYGQLPNRLF